MRKKKVLGMIIMFLSLSVYSQIAFEKGYYIDNRNVRTDCLIKNPEWRFCPEEITYKLNEEDSPKTLKIFDVKEFKILNSIKYVRYTVEIDRSSQNLNNLSTKRNPQWSEESVFLKVLVEGKASLYGYYQQNIRKFFFKIDQEIPEQLIYKIYSTGHYQTASNITFINQLYKDVNCLEKDIDRLQYVQYNEKDLKAYFIENNQCSDPDYNVENSTFQSVKGDFNIKPYAGVAFSSLSVFSTVGSDEYNIDFDNKTGVKLGVELEYVLPFDKNKWSILLDLNYISYQASFEKDISGAYSTVHLEAEADLKALQFPFGIRYYVFFNDDSKIYFNAGFNYAVFMDSKVFISGTGDLDIASSKGMFGGLGYTFKNKYTIDLSYQNGDIFNTYLYRDSDYKVLSLNFKYTIF